MDEQTFRRLSPDAVAGRLDEATYRSWKAAAAQDPERAAFVVRVVEADARVSAVRPAVMPRAEAPARVPRHRALGLAVLFAMLGLLAGGLVMNSYLRNQAGRPVPPALNAPDNTPVAKQEPSAGDAGTAPPADAPPAQPANQPQTWPQIEPQPQPEPQPEPEGLAVVALAGDVAVRGAGEQAWRKLALHEVVPEGATVSSLRKGYARFRSAGVEIFPHDAFQFELVGGAIRFMQGRFSVRVSSRQKFTCYKESWELEQGGFIVEPKTLGGELWLVEGDALFQGRQGAQLMKPHVRVALDGTRNATPLEPQQILSHELELLKPCNRLLWWDGETPGTTPALCELIEPGALGDGRAMAHKSGQAGIGVSPSTDVFTAPQNARLRMRVKTSAPRLRVELRVQLEQGYRVVDAFVDLTGSGEWSVVDVPLEILRAGRFRDEPGWLPGRDYSALLIAPAVDPDRPLTRHDLAIDNLLVYEPR
ncbi:MAG: hypothetical protein M5U25_17730 [Planctomycetota bacterium]|nr:hypothetical protein [Planctomycetota bacterium]